MNTRYRFSLINKLFGNICKELNLYQDVSSTRDRDLEEEWEQIKSAAELLHLMRIMKTQSGFESYDSGHTSDVKIMTVSGGTRSQNILFTDQIDPHMYEVESYTDRTRTLQDSNDATLENFFKRPIKIAQEEWGASTTLGFTVNPWSEYFNDPRVLARIANYNLLRCKMHIKIVLNGNGFQYGRLLASYLPLAAFDDFTTPTALVIQDAVQASQCPHLYLDPCTSQGGEMILPFFYHQNYMNVSESKWDEMGELFIRTLNPLRNANGSDSIATITIFAWAEDVHMSVLTSVPPQSGREVDEVNAKGTVSGPATAIAKVATALSSAPIIGPYAMATAKAANTTAAIAKSLGYCRPPVTRDLEPMKPHVISSLALTNVGDGVSKMSVDDKQELSVDPRIAGLGPSDPLSIKEIAKRESYITQFPWNVGTSTESLLFNIRVAPVIWAESGFVDETAFHFPACAMAAMPFKYWTGTMRYRFQVVCSAFHKGRIKLVYDPNYLNTNVYNTQYTQIVDIADKTDFTVEIACGQPRTLLRNPQPGIDSVTQMYSTSPYISGEDWGNGVLGVYVVNQLTIPNSTIDADISVNVFVSAGDDFEVFVPDDRFQYFTFRGQSGLEPKSVVSESQNTMEPSAPQHDMATTLGPTLSDNNDINKVFTGEAIASFRTMLKRYNLWNALSPCNGSTWVLAGRLAAYPYYRGPVAGAVGNSSSGPYNFCNTVLMHWVTNAFSGWRGSIRYKLLLRGPISQNCRPTYYISRSPSGVAPYYINDQAQATFITPDEASYSIIMFENPQPRPLAPLSGARGVAFSSGYLNPTLEFEVPYYSDTRFTPGKLEDYTTSPVYCESWDYRIFLQGTEETIIDIQVAAGEDFQTYFFTGLPRMYYNSIAPAPA